MKIDSIKLRKILDSRAKYTVEAEINGFSGKAPSGASTGTHEAKCFVPEELEGIEEELRQLEGKVLDQKEFDDILKDIDGTEDFSRIGAVGIACSLAFKQASGFNHGKEFPLPLSNVIGGGEHGGNTSIQEFLVLPVNAESFPKAIETNRKIYNELKETHKRKIKGMNDEGALITSMNDEETLRALKQIADKHGARIGLDVAASEFFEEGIYSMNSMGLEHGPEKHLKFIQKLIDVFDLVYVEDPFDQEDFRLHAKLTNDNPDVFVCGDDLFTTNSERLQEGIDNGACNSLIVKPNQIGTLSDTLETVNLTKENDYAPVISHRSGETTDSSISDLSLEWNCPVIKAGIADIRIAKLNRLLKLWDETNNAEVYQR